MMAKQNGTLTMIPGDVREAQGWHQTIGTFTMLAYQQMPHKDWGQGLLDSRIGLGPNNWHSHCAMKRCNMFQRGHSTQFAQVPSGHNYILTQDEVDSMCVIRLDHYNPLQLSSRWNWSAGCLWEYSQPVNVNNAIQAVYSGDQTVMTILCQGICNEEIGPLQSSSVSMKDFRFRIQIWWLTTILAIQITRHGEQSLRLRLRWQGSDPQWEWQWCWAVSASVEAPQGRNQRRQVAPDQWAAQWMISAQSGHCTAREAYVSFESLLADNEGTETETMARRSHNDAARIWRWLEQGSEPI